MTARKGMSSHENSDLAALVAQIRACRRCIEAPIGRPLPHEPRPVIRAQPTARLLICGQAPGTRVHATGTPFLDPSGDRLREWMGIGPDEFYDEERVAIVPMGFCFPGLDGPGSDLPPRRECAPLWRERVMSALPNIQLVLLVGMYALRWHLGPRARGGVTNTVENWRVVYDASDARRTIPLPHPSWRNNAWIKRHPWFSDELLPILRTEVRRALGRHPIDG